MKTILEDFIRTKRKQHVQPKRVGVPRGDKIGISQPKFEAALIVTLCNFDLKGLSENLGGSYEVLRRWKAEASFKELCSQIRDEFLWMLDLEIEAIVVEIVSAYKAGQFDADFKERFEIFKDINIYNQRVIEHIGEALKKYLSIDGGKLLFFDLLSYLATHSGNPLLNDLLIQTQKKICEKTIHAIGNPDVSENERKEVALCLSRVLR